MHDYKSRTWAHVVCIRKPPHQAAHQTVPMFCRTACQNPLGLQPRRQQSMPYPQCCFNTEGHGRLGVLSSSKVRPQTELNESAHFKAIIYAEISLPASVSEKSQPHENHLETSSCRRGAMRRARPGDTPLQPTSQLVRSESDRFPASPSLLEVSNSGGRGKQTKQSRLYSSDLALGSDTSSWSSKVNLR